MRDDSYYCHAAFVYAMMFSPRLRWCRLMMPDYIFFSLFRFRFNAAWCWYADDAPMPLRYDVDARRLMPVAWCWCHIYAMMLFRCYDAASRYAHYAISMLMSICHDDDDADMLTLIDISRHAMFWCRCWWCRHARDARYWWRYCLCLCRCFLRWWWWCRYARRSYAIARAFMIYVFRWRDVMIFAMIFFRLIIFHYRHCFFIIHYFRATFDAMSPMFHYFLMPRCRWCFILILLLLMRLLLMKDDYCFDAVADIYLFRCYYFAWLLDYYFVRLFYLICYASASLYLFDVQDDDVAFWWWWKIAPLLLMIFCLRCRRYFIFIIDADIIIIMIIHDVYFRPMFRLFRLPRFSDYRFFARYYSLFAWLSLWYWYDYFSMFDALWARHDDADDAIDKMMFVSLPLPDDIMPDDADAAITMMILLRRCALFCRCRLMPIILIFWFIFVWAFTRLICCHLP